MQTGNGIEINGEKKEYDLTSINNGPNVSTNPDNTTVATEDVNNNVSETQQPVVEQTTPEVSSNETSTPVESASKNTTTNQVEQASAPSTPEPPLVTQESAPAQPDSSNPIDQISQFVKTNIDTTNITNEIKDPKNKKTIIIICVIVGVIVLLGVIIFIISSLASKSDLPGTYGCYKLENSWRKEYSEVIIFNKNGTWKLGDYDDINTDYLAGRYKSKILSGSKKNILDVSLEINEDVTKGKSKKDSGTIGVYIGKMKDGKYDFTYKDGTTMICEKGINLGKTTTTTEDQTTTTTSAVKNDDHNVYEKLSVEVLEVVEENEQGVLIKGKVGSGELYVNDEVRVVNLKDSSNSHTAIIKEVKRLDSAIPDAKNNYNVEVLLSGITKDIFTTDVPDSTFVITSIVKETNQSKFESTISVRHELENGNTESVKKGETYIFDFSGVKVSGKVIDIVQPEGTNELQPGDPGVVQIELEDKVNMKEATRYYILLNDKCIGEGMVTKIIK